MIERRHTLGRLHFPARYTHDMKNWKLSTFDHVKWHWAENPFCSKRRRMVKWDFFGLVLHQTGNTAVLCYSQYPIRLLSEWEFKNFFYLLADECGIVAQISEPLATADIPAYYISTFKFDHALVRRVICVD